jgi:hypothetical protein
MGLMDGFHSDSDYREHADMLNTPKGPWSMNYLDQGPSVRLGDDRRMACRAHSRPAAWRGGGEVTPLFAIELEVKSWGETKIIRCLVGADDANEAKDRATLPYSMGNEVIVLRCDPFTPTHGGLFYVQERA